MVFLAWEITIYTVYIYVYIRFWPTLSICYFKNTERKSGTMLDLRDGFAFYTHT